MARASTQAKGKDVTSNQSLSIYLSLLGPYLWRIPFLNPALVLKLRIHFQHDPLNLRMTMAEIKAQISEIMWAKATEEMLFLG